MPANPSLDYSLPQLRAAEAKLRVLAQQMGISYALAQYGGMRTQADTNQILNYRLADYRAAVKANPRVANIPINTWRPIAPFGRSLHNWGAAFDIVITGTPPGVSAGKALAMLGAAAPQAGLRWGGNFPPAVRDVPHFELPVSVVDARAAYMQYTNGKGYQGPRSPFGFISEFFTPRSTAATASQLEMQSVGPVMPEVQYIPTTPTPSFSNIRVEAMPLPPQREVPVNAETEEGNGEQQSESGRVVGRISSNARPSYNSGYMLADIGDVPVRTDATDAKHLAAAQEAERKRHGMIVAGVVIVGLIVASSRQRRGGR